MPDSLSFPAALIDALRAARSVVVLTGAGVSAESGVPTFRDAQSGLWERYRPEDLATPEAFERDPALVWRWYAERRARLRDVAPNPGHDALVALAARSPSFTLITQNVDGLHARAGSRDVIALHGDITRTRCFERGHVVDSWPETDQIPPPCPICGGRLRPDVVWFGEALPREALTRATRAAREGEIFLSVGTSGLVYPAAELPFEALRSGARVVEINPTPTPLSPHAHWTVAAPSGVALPALLAALSG